MSAFEMAWGDDSSNNSSICLSYCGCLPLYLLSLYSRMALCASLFLSLPHLDVQNLCLHASPWVPLSFCVSPCMHLSACLYFLFIPCRFCSPLSLLLSPALSLYLFLRLVAFSLCLLAFDRLSLSSCECLSLPVVSLSLCLYLCLYLRLSVSVLRLPKSCVWFKQSPWTLPIPAVVS